jgi:ubiquinone/menaquinone biosynthesis C-methylase UbiE
MLELLTNHPAAPNIRNVKPVLGTTTDPKLPRASVDLILLVDVYHEFDHPFEMVEAMIRALKPGGRIVFVEFRTEDPNVPIKRVHKMTEAQVRKEMSIHPLQWVETLATSPQQHVIVFRKKPGAKVLRQSFVRIPHARTRHQPRIASNIANKPNATRSRHSQSL